MFWRRVDVEAAVDKFCKLQKIMVCVSHKSTRLYLTEYSVIHMHTPNYTKSRDHALVMYCQII